MATGAVALGGDEDNRRHDGLRQRDDGEVGRIGLGGPDLAHLVRAVDRGQGRGEVVG